MHPDAAVFTGPAGTFLPDTCSPLRDAGRDGKVGLWAYGRGTYPGEPMDPAVLPQLKSVGMWEATSDQDWGLDWHRNEGIEFTCISSGRVPFSCEADEFDLTAGHITVTRPWQIHRVGRPDVTSSTLTWFNLDVDVRRPNQDWVWPAWLPIPETDLQRLTEMLSHTDKPVWRASKGLLSAVGSLQHTLRDNASHPMARIATSVSEIFIELLDLLEQQQPELNPYFSSTERTVELFLKRLPERVDEPWTIDSMARECGLKRTRFVHYCRQLVNVAPLEYLLNVRMQRARHLLTHTDLRVSDVAQMCGFASSQYFSTVFRRHTSLQPAQHRRQSQVSAAEVLQPVSA